MPRGEQAEDPKQQEEMDTFIANGFKLIHNPKVSDGFIKRIVDSPDPAQAIADSTLEVVNRIKESAKGIGKKLSLATLAQGGNVLMGEIITVAETAGMPPLDDETKYKAFSLAIGEYLQQAIQTGEMTKEEVMKLAAEAKQTPEGQKIEAEAEKMAGPEGAQGGATPPPVMPPQQPAGRM